MITLKSLYYNGWRLTVLTQHNDDQTKDIKITFNKRVFPKVWYPKNIWSTLGIDEVKE